MSDDVQTKSMFFESIDLALKNTIVIFIEETDGQYISSWNNPTDEDYITASAARAYLFDFDGDVLAASKAYNMAHKKGLDAMRNAYKNEIEKANLSPQPKLEEFGGDQKAYDGFVFKCQSVAKRAYDAAFDNSYPVRRNHMNNQKFTVQ